MLNRHGGARAVLPKRTRRNRKTVASCTLPALINKYGGASTTALGIVYVVKQPISYSMLLFSLLYFSLLETMTGRNLEYDAPLNIYTHAPAAATKRTRALDRAHGFQRGVAGSPVGGVQGSS